jgi:phage repressor protein C with HTH and peptisase S24 domain
MIGIIGGFSDLSREVPLPLPDNAAHAIEMSAESTNPIVQRIDAIIARKGLTRASAGRLAKLSPDYIRKLGETSDRSGNLTKLAQLANALDVPLSDITGESAEPAPSQDPLAIARGDARPAAVRMPPRDTMPRDVPVLGTVAGSAIGSFQFTSDVIDYVRRPPALVGVETYAVYVENESMVPRYNPGDLVFVHPRRPVLKGDAVVIQIKNSAGADMEGFIKIFQSRTAEWIIVEQLNPASIIRYKRETVQHIHKVLTMNDLFGV